jgi:polyphosphate kinase
MDQSAEEQGRQGTAAAAAETAAPETPKLGAPSLYSNRELSWLDFNDRVLQLLEDPQYVPLLERVKFAAIFASNLDEFFMVRVAGLHDQIDAGIAVRGPDGSTPSETLDRVADRTRELTSRHAKAFTQALLPALSEQGIRIVTCADCGAEELDAIDKRFRDQIFPVLTPLAVGPGRPFPYISNLSLSLIVRLRDPVSGSEAFARVKVPKEVLPRFVSIGNDTFVPLEEVIARHLDYLFPGMEIVSHDLFRVTRDADFTISDEADDLVRAVETELRRRRFGEVVRVEVGATMDPEMRAKLVDWLEVEERQIYDIEGTMDLTDLSEIYGIDGYSELRDTPWSPLTQPRLQSEEGEPIDLFKVLRQGDVLVHFPYDSFKTSVERLVEQAVRDPDVLAIKLTVYRTSDDSALVPALIEAAERGKQAVCMVELKARFDERRNIGWARALEEVGAHVVHGLPGLKTHAKALLIVRREGDGVRHYVHIGTGNYHAKTARLYEDFGLFTSDRRITADVADMFNSLTGYARPLNYREVLVAPDHTRDGLLNEITRTIAAHDAGEDARIVMKMNSLVDRRSIDALYEASQAGVPVDLSIRGICCLRPGVPGVSENIRVTSVVGRFLEHSRIYGFIRGSERRYYIGSADLMPRNLDHRVELLAPVKDEALKGELEDTLERSFADDTFAWELQPDGEWRRRRGGTRRLHTELMQRAVQRGFATD